MKFINDVNDASETQKKHDKILDFRTSWIMNRKNCVLKMTQIVETR